MMGALLVNIAINQAIGISKVRGNFPHVWRASAMQL